MWSKYKIESFRFGMPMAMIWGAQAPPSLNMGCRVTGQYPKPLGDCAQWRKPGAEFGGRKNFSPTKMTFFSEKISILSAKICDDLF